MKIISVIGARPQFIKAAVICREFAHVSNLQSLIIHTGQHFDENMSKVFFEEMGIPKPDFNLGVSGLGHGAMTGRMLEGIEDVLLKEMPDIVLVYGDTNSTLAGAIAAKKLHIKVAHVEAGLRSFNMDMPEEINRILTDRISDFLFCPNDIAVENLKKEGFVNFNCTIVNCGDVMKDASLYYKSKAKKPICSLPKEYVLCTLHRAENTDNKIRLMSIISALEEISLTYKVVLPLHPRTKKKLESINFDFSNTNIFFIDPVGYLEMVYLQQNCKIILTDSGGLQKEAYFFGKYCITLRDETEWLDLVQSGYNILSGADKVRIIDCFKKSLSLSDHPNFSKCLYGNGKAGNTITKFLVNNIN
jgi:UDP-GlcNAc3NAcA epimerase